MDVTMKHKAKTIYLRTVIITAIVASILYAIAKYLVQINLIYRAGMSFYLGSFLFIFYACNIPGPLFFICSFFYFRLFFFPVMCLLKAKEKESFYGVIAFYGLILLQVLILLVHLTLPVVGSFLVLTGFD